ncbi:gluconate 2-dehydrogenase subunit 3 family protein [Sphingomonas sp.]|uniref:gluconate 2-dehydrogenase subunit 3 family protein n=1 Tax=Sphingomonas sp. TaxID=28214 RepID=UPI001EB2F8AD|nr:gluconate 2-dehydrogenase subunit 3 family protein [Sphingomonas sp.]MBX3592858.1 gluconate 2-dehydrogenase subunit 3 family protein [Sphingomonas sp.]
MSEVSAQRRDVLAGAALFALVVGVPLATVRLTELAAEDRPSERQRQMIAAAAQHVIPRTDTPGAGEVGVGDFIVLALAHGLNGTREPAAGGIVTSGGSQVLRRDGTLRYLAWLEAVLDRRANGDWLSKSPARRAEILAALDAEAFPQGPPPPVPSPWVALKGLILTGYYTSETGGATELRYELVPGRFDPDLPLAPGDRAWSSDWTAVEFG